MKAIPYILLVISIIFIASLSIENNRLRNSLKTMTRKYEMSDSLWLNIQKTCTLISTERIKKIDGNMIVLKEPFER